MNHKKPFMFLAPLALGVASALLVAAFGLFSGGITPAFAHDTAGVGHLEIDANVSDGVCTDVDTGAAVFNGTTVTVGICLSNTADAPISGTITAAIVDVTYPAGLTATDCVSDLALDLDCGATDWDEGDAGGAGDIGADWDCNGSNAAATAPSASPSPANFTCETADSGPNAITAGAGPGAPVAIAKLTFNPATVGGAQALGFAASTALILGGAERVCGISLNCAGATITVVDAADISLGKDCTPDPITLTVAGPNSVTCSLTVTNGGNIASPNVLVVDSYPSANPPWTLPAVVYNDAATDLANGANVCNDISFAFSPGYPATHVLNLIGCGTLTGALPSSIAIVMPVDDVQTFDIVYDVPLGLAGKSVLDHAVAFSANAPSASITLNPADPDLTPLAGYLKSPAGPCNPAAAPPDVATDTCAITKIIGSAYAALGGTGALCGQPPVGPFNCDNGDTHLVNVTQADVTISKTPSAASVTAGGSYTWAITITNGVGLSAASDISVTDYVDSDQTITGAAGAGWVCGLPTGGTGNNVTCTRAAALAGGASDANLVVNVDISDPTSDTSCQNGATVTFADPETNDTGTTDLIIDAGDPGITCPGANVSMNKDKHPETATLENVVNLWICEPAWNGLFSGVTLLDPFGDFLDPGTSPNCDENGEGRLLIAEVLSNINDPQGLGAYEFQIKYDHKIFDINVTDSGFLYLTGRVPTAGGPGDPGGCQASIFNENAILFGCVSKDPDQVPPITLGPTGSGTVAVVEILPEPDLKFRLHPGQENGIVRKILDENCEAADIFGDPLADATGAPLQGISNGGLIDECGDLDVTVRILEGDLNLDCEVSVEDDQLIAFRYGAFFGSLRYDPWFDMEPALKDFDIDIKDLQKVFGRNGSVCSQSGTEEDGTFPEQPPVAALSNGPL